MLNLSLDELKAVAKISMFKDDLTKILSKSETGLKLSEERIKDIKGYFNKIRDRFLKPKIKKIKDKRD